MFTSYAFLYIMKAMSDTSPLYTQTNSVAGIQITVKWEPPATGEETIVVKSSDFDFISASIINDSFGVRCAKIGMVNIQERFLGQGLGTKLMERMISELRKLNVKSLRGRIIEIPALVIRYNLLPKVTHLYTFNAANEGRGIPIDKSFDEMMAEAEAKGEIDVWCESDL